MKTVDSDRKQRFFVGALVVGVHLGLFWLLTAMPPARRTEGEPVRLRLVLIAPPPASVVPRPQQEPTAARPRPQAARIETPPPTRSQPYPLPNESGLPAVRAPIDWHRQARDWSRTQTPAEAENFVPDPLRSRRANLPGGDRRDTFAMRRATSPADAVAMIGGLFGAYPPPCPRVRDNIAGLLTSTSDRDRALLQEELRRQREDCAP